jgi:hypothetical protein
MLKKTGKFLLISLTAIFIVAYIGYFIYLYSIYTLIPGQLVKEMNPLPAELIALFDQANLDEPESCVAALEEIGNVTGSGIEDPIDFLQTMTFMNVSDEIEQQFEHVRQLADDAGFSFSFAELNSCEQNTFFKLDKPSLRQSLVELEESMKVLNEMCGENY